MILAILAGIMLEQYWPAAGLTGGAKPPILLGVVAYYALQHSLPLMLAAALLGGLLSDGVAALPMGSACLALAALGTSLHYCRARVFSGKLVTSIVFGVACGAAAPLIVFSLLVLFSPAAGNVQWPGLALKIIGSGVYGAFIFPALDVFLERLELLTGARAAENFSDDHHSDN